MPDTATDRTTTSPFAYPIFRRYWTARFLAAFAAQIATVAIGWQLYDATGDAFLLGMVGLAEFSPSIALVLVTGAAADRIDRGRLVAACLAAEVACTVVLLVIYLRGGTPLVPIFVTLVAFGIARAFISPALQSTVPSLVPADQLSTAIAWNTSSWQIASVVGPLFGGLLYGIDGAVAYGVAAAMLAAALVTILWSLWRDKPLLAPPSEGAVNSLFAGFAFVRRQPVVLGAISLDLFAVLLGGATALLPAYARDILHTGPWGLGLLRSASGAGAIVMGLWLSRYPLRRNAGIVMFAGVAVFGLFTVVFGLSTLLWLSILSLFIMGAGDMLSVYVRETLIQLATPDEVRGRVNAVNMVFIGASNELGAARAGTMAAWIGVVPAVVLGGIGTMMVAALWAWGFPVLRRQQRLDGLVEKASHGGS